MIEQTISVEKALTYLAWGGTLSLLASAAVVGIFADHWWVALLLAEASCVISAIAATLTVRCYLSKLAALVRVSATGSPEPTTRIQSLR